MVEILQNTEKHVIETNNTYFNNLRVYSIL